MNNKTLVLLLVVLGINTLRYGSYLLEGSTSTYYLVFFSLNLLSMIVVGIKAFKNTDANRISERKQE